MGFKTFISYFALFILMDMQSYGQTETYFEGKELKKYEGEWVGVHNKDTFRIILQYKEKYPMTKGNTILVDAIFGWHSFIENGVKKSSTITYPLDPNNRSITMGMDANGKVFMHFADKDSKNGAARISFDFIPGSTTQALWKIEKITHSGVITSSGINAGNRKATQNEGDYPNSQITSVSEWLMTRIK